MSAPWPAIAVIGVLGLAVGSFLNVVIYRVPRSQSVMFPGSRCPDCESPIKGRHNVPVVSWIVQRGRCHSCASRTSARVPLIEAGTGALFAAITWHFGLSVALPAYLYLAAIGVTVAVMEFDVRRLPDSIILPSYVLSLLMLMPAGAVDADWRTAERALAGMLALVALFFALALAYPNGGGFGDVKLAGLLGIYLGWLSWTALFIAAIGSLFIAAAGGTAAIAVKHASRSVAVPLAPCLVAAAVLALFIAAPVSSWYGSLITV
jgi:leader peptidase (prepilin peptidase)/N-methyltransferase